MINWNSVENNLPVKNGSYLCYISYITSEGGYFDILNFDTDGFYSYVSEYSELVKFESVKYWAEINLPEGVSELC